MLYDGLSSENIVFLAEMVNYNGLNMLLNLKLFTNLCRSVNKYRTVLGDLLHVPLVFFFSVG